MKILKSQSITRNYVDLGVVAPTMMNEDNRRDTHEDDGNTIDKSILDNNIVDEHVEQASPKPSVEPQLRRSTKMHRPSQKKFLYYKYVITMEENHNATKRP